MTKQQTDIDKIVEALDKAKQDRARLVAQRELATERLAELDARLSAALGSPDWAKAESLLGQLAERATNALQELRQAVDKI